MIEFESRSDLNHYYYQLFRDLSDSRIHLSKKLLKQVEKDIQNDYSLNIKVMNYNEKFVIKMKLKELLLSRKMMKKDFRYYKKNFKIEYFKKKPIVSVSVNTTTIRLSDSCLPKIKYTSSIKGKVSWDSYMLDPGINSYAWTFVPEDSKYSVVKGFLDIAVLDDTNNNKNND